ncbi:DNA translocase FtsK [Xanthobacter sp. KR7-65]|uniref:DNA translocase FtsK n=1 Tax=Xanthobacter sp. KR7-65 TaxID=3156612 RepID=UPI0032B5BED8
MPSFNRPPKPFAFPPHEAEPGDSRDAGTESRGLPSFYERIPEYDPAAEPFSFETAGTAPTHSWLDLELIPSWLRPFTLDANTRFTRTPDHFLRPREAATAPVQEVSSRGWHFLFEAADDLAAPVAPEPLAPLEPAAAPAWAEALSAALLPHASSLRAPEAEEMEQAAASPAHDASAAMNLPEAQVLDAAAPEAALADEAPADGLPEPDPETPISLSTDLPAPLADLPEVQPAAQADEVDEAEVPAHLWSLLRLVVLGRAAVPPGPAEEQDLDPAQADADEAAGEETAGSAAAAGDAALLEDEDEADEDEASEDAVALSQSWDEDQEDAEESDADADVEDGADASEDEAEDDESDDDGVEEDEEDGEYEYEEEEASGEEEELEAEDLDDELEVEDAEGEDDAAEEAEIEDDAAEDLETDDLETEDEAGDLEPEQPLAAMWRPYQHSISAQFLGTPFLGALAQPAAQALVPAPRAPAPPVAAPKAAVPALAPVGSEADAADGPYCLPPLDLLREPPLVEPDYELSEEFLDQSSAMLQQVLRDFGVRGEVIDANPGPVVTLYEFEPAPGVKSSRVIGLSADIARSMSAVSARVAVVEGRNVIGIELPNRRRETVWLRELLASQEFSETHPKLGLCLGKTIGGVPVIADLARMPHLLVAGTTGSGKSVAINTMILSLLYRHTPEACRLIMIDPKMLELSVYEGIPHLLTPVVTDPKKAIIALKWAVKEMEERYKKMSRLAVRNIDGYNARVREAAAKGEVITRNVQVGFDKETGESLFEEQEMDLSPLPFIVVIVDEMADLMMVAGKEIEGAIQRLAQMARAAGIHLVMATQRPSVDVITGTIKANFPTRISFQVTSKIDSRTILGEMGAETLLGQGDMLFMAGGGRITRVHGPFVSDGEVEKVVAFLKAQGGPDYLDAVILDEAEEMEEDDDAVFDRSGMADAGGDLYEQAVAIVMRDRKASTSYIQRRLQVGYNKAASLMERMENEGIVGPANHAGKRDILTFSRPG